MSRRDVAALVRRRYIVIASAALMVAATAAGVELAGASAMGPAMRPSSPGVPGAQPMVSVPGLSTDQVAQAATYLGTEPAASPVDLEVVLAPSNGPQLAQLVSEVSSPASPLYHHFLTEQQFVAQFGPPPSVVAAAESWLGSDGLTVSQSSPLVLSVAGSASAAAGALGVRFGRYSQAGATGLVATGAPHLPADLAGGEVSGILGLDTLAQPRDFAAPAPVPAGAVAAPGLDVAPQTEASSPTACGAATNAAGDDDSYTVDQLASHYGVNSLEQAGQDGAGVTMALVEINASSSTDISSYETCFGLTNPVSVVDVDGGPPSGSVDVGEADIDIEMAATLAPDASIVAYESPATDAGLFDSLQVIVKADTARVISISLGQCEPGSQQFADSMHGLMEQAAMQGQSVVVSSGDSGSEGCFSGSSTPTADSLTADYPASDPLVTSVGGTVLTPAGELAWDDCNGAGNVTCAEGLVAGASGGGVSTIFSPGPSGQPELNGTGGYREVPDVSAVSGSNYGEDVELYTDVDNNPGWSDWLGTSLGAPLWAGLLADRDTTCTSPAGDFDPELYSLYNNGYYASAFNPVTEGYTYSASTLVPEASSNDFTQTNGGDYPTGVGYNMVTGLGTPIASGLACSQVVGSYSGDPGQTVTLDGVGLENASIYVGSAAAQVVSASASQVTVDVPAGSGEVPVYAEGVLGQSSQTGEFTYSAIGTTTTTTVPTTSTTTTSTTTTSTTTTSTTTSTTVPTTSTTSTTTSTASTTTVPTTTSTTASGPTTTTTVPITTSTTARTTTTTSAPTTTTTGVPTTTTTAPTTTSTAGETTTTTSAPPAGGGGGGLSGGAGGSPPPMTTTTTGTPTTTVKVPSVTLPTTTTTAPKNNAAVVVSTGFWMVSRDGGVYVFGKAGYHGSLPARKVHTSDIVAMAPVPGDHGGGYWMVGKDGNVYKFGTAANFGTLPHRGIHVKNIVAMAATPSGKGYWLVGATGKVFAFGDAVNFGSVKTTGRQLPAIVAIASTRTGYGYWVVSSTGKVWSFGNAANFGSLKGGGGAITDIVGMAASPAGNGYWLVGRNGAVFDFGSADKFGARANAKDTGGSVGIASTSDGGGYWVVSANGAVTNYGDAGAEGSLPALKLVTKAVVGVASP